MYKNLYTAQHVFIIQLFSTPVIIAMHYVKAISIVQ